MKIGTGVRNQQALLTPGYSSSILLANQQKCTIVEAEEVQFA